MDSRDRTNDMLSIRSVASATGLSPKAVRRRIERGTLESVIVDGRRRVSPEELRRRGLLPERRSSTPPAPSGLLPPAVPADDPMVRKLLARMNRLESRVEHLESQLRHADDSDGQPA